MNATPGQAAGCGCPETDGKIYHQRGTCTDPVVEQLDWYADSGRIAAAPEAKPGPSLADLLDQATRELNGATALVHQRKLAAGLRAQAGLEALPLWGAADPVTVTPAVARPYFGSTLILAVPPDTDEADVQRLRDHLAASAPEDHVTVVAVRGIEALRTWEPQSAPVDLGTTPRPAPELAAAMDAPAALARVLSWFEQFGTRRTAIATRAQLAHAYQDGGLTVPEDLRRFL